MVIQSLPLALLPFFIAVANCSAQSTATSDQAARSAEPASSFAAQYASDRFSAACYLRPAALAKHPFLSWLALDIRSAPPLSVERLQGVGISELVVFCGVDGDDIGAIGSAPNKQLDVQWGAAARFASPVALEQRMRDWRSTLAPNRFVPLGKPTPLRIANRDGFRIPSGTFFPPRRTYGSLRFTDRQGRSSKGINVGRVYDYRSYIEGNTECSAIFTMPKVTPKRLVDGKLPLDLTLDVFRTRRLPHDHNNCQLFLRNPKTHTRSTAIPFQAQSHVLKRLHIDRRVATLDDDGKIVTRDLFDSLTDEGSLEVVIQGLDEATYLGFGKYDLGLPNSAHEYAMATGRTLVIAQSKQVLASMLQRGQAPSTFLAKRLSTGSDLSLIVDASKPAGKLIRERLPQLLGNTVPVKLMAESAQTIDANYQAGTAKWDVQIEMASRKDALLLPFKMGEWFQQVRRNAMEAIDRYANQEDPLGSLLSMVFEGASLQFPRLPGSQREARSRLRSLVTKTSTRPKLAVDERRVRLKFQDPPFFANLSKESRFALAKQEEQLARDLFESEQFHLADAMYRRACLRIGDAPEIWFRRAHHLAFNLSHNFDAYDMKYDCLRRGILSLLEGAEHDPKNRIDCLWMCAYFLARKVGLADERKQYQMRFARDKALHARLAKHISLDNLGAENDQLDNWRVAQLLFQSCIKHRASSGDSPTIPVVLFHSGPANTQARLASQLDQNGAWDAAEQAWARAETRYRQLGERRFSMPGGVTIQLSQWQARLEQFGKHDDQAKLIEQERDRILYAYWVARCNLEQTAEIRAARRIAHQANSDLDRQDLPQAFEHFRRALQQLRRSRQTNPQEWISIANSFRGIAKGCRSIEKKLQRGVEPELEEVLLDIEASKPLLPFRVFQPK